MKTNLHLLRCFLACAWLASLTVWAWAAPLASKATPSPPQASDPRYDVVVEQRSLATEYLHTYTLLTPGKHKFLPAEGYTLVIALHSLGGGDAPSWMALVDSRPDVVVALPEVTDSSRAIPIITEMIDDTVAHEHVNPKRVFLAGYSAGGSDGSVIVGARPDLFAGFADISAALDRRFYSPALKKSADKMALYLSSGTKESNDENVAFSVTQLKNFGFTQIYTDRPDCGHDIPEPIFERLTKNMMTFFDRMLAANKPKEKAEADTLGQLAKNMVMEKRSLPQSKGNYVFLTPDRTKFPATKESTLLICLHGSGDTADNFAKNWTDLVKSRADVVVAIPEATPNTSGNIWGPDSAGLVKAIIDDTVARDHVDPQQIILAGSGVGCTVGGGIMGEHPELFLGFADFATDLPDAFFTPALKKNAANLAVYYAVGTKNDYLPTAVGTVINRLESFGFNYLPQPPIFHQIWDFYGPEQTELFPPPDFDQTNLLFEKFDTAHGLTADEFKYRITRMMHFFDQVKAEKERMETAATVPAVETRTLAKPQGGYLLLKSDQRNFSAVKGTTLLICLHGGGDTAASYAKYWMNLVQCCPAVIVAVPETAPISKDAEASDGGPGATDLVAAIIADTVVRDHVNPQQVILAGYGLEGGRAAGSVLGERPDLFAGFAALATPFPDSFFTAAVKKNAAKMAVYYEIETKNPEYNPADLASAKARLKDFGFNDLTGPYKNFSETGNLRMGTPNFPHNQTVDEFNKLTPTMMSFFYHVWAANNKKETVVIDKN